LYVAVAKYVSFILAVPWLMCPLDSEMLASPSQPLLPYVPLQTSTRPSVALHRRPARPLTRVSSMTLDFVQSLVAVVNSDVHALVTLSPAWSPNGLAVLAQ
jgi:hypothetical protein